jgi:hypothetical protein
VVVGDLPQAAKASAAEVARTMRSFISIPISCRSGTLAVKNRCGKYFAV